MVSRDVERPVVRARVSELVQIDQPFVRSRPDESKPPSPVGHIGGTHLLNYPLRISPPQSTGLADQRVHEQVLQQLLETNMMNPRCQQAAAEMAVPWTAI